MNLRILAACIILAAPLFAHAGLFSVSPVRIDITPTAKSGSISINNDGASLPLRVKLMRWTQDENGESVYTPASDLVYFPREMTVEPGTTRSIRILAPASPKGPEVAYRLFIEEQMPPDSPETGGHKAVKVSVLVNFGVAVYVRGDDSPPVLSATVVKDAAGHLALELQNTGTSHTFVNSLSARGLTFSGFKPRYILGGAVSPVAVDLSSFVCAPTANDLVGDTAEGNVNIRLDATAAGCTR
jgi:fimbrial chaperone protein